MRTPTKIAAMSAALLALAACGRTKTDAKNDALSKDLQLASSSIDLATTRPNNITLSPVEEMPLSKPERARSLKKAAGPKAVRSHTPTVRATPTTEAAAEQPAPQTQTVEAPSPVPEAAPAPSLPPATRPSPAPIPGPDPGTGRAQGDGGGSTIGAILGGILGGVILGGGVDGDRCEPHGGRRGRGPYGGGVIVPVYPRGGGIPINPIR